MDGWVLASRVGDEVLDWLRQAALPAVVVGGDTVTAALWDPPLTTVRMPMREMGAAAFRRLLERIERPDLPATRRVLPVEMVVRGSTAPPPD